jgi:YwiC-like protein
MAAHINTLSNPRMRTMVVPREHGAWGMLLVPLATGAVVAAHGNVHGSALALFVCAAMSLFWLRTPVESWLGTSAIKAHTSQERAFVLRTIAGVGVVAAASIALLLWAGRNRELMLIGLIAAGAFAAQAAVKKLGRNGRMPAQIIGAIGLTSTAAGAYYVATGQLDRTAIALWLANWLFAGDQIHFVQLRIHASRAGTLEQKLQQGRSFLFAQIVLVGIIVAACRVGLFPAAAILAFLPVLLRGSLWFVRKRQPLDVHKLGFTELAHALTFGALLCAAFMI